METTEMTPVFTDCINKLWHAFGCLVMDLLHARFDDRYSCVLQFDTRQIDLDLDSRAQECKKAKTSATIIMQIFNQFKWNLIDY